MPMLRLIALLMITLGCLEPLACHAQDNTTPSIVDYAFQGFGTGAAVGLAAGYLLTQPHWESKDWKTVGLGAGIGALSGLGIGLVLGIVDATTSPNGPGVGFYVMRDMNLGDGLGFLAGGVVGAIMWASGGRGKDVLLGFAYGTLIGAGAGLVLGILEGVLRRPSRAKAESASSGLSFHLGVTSGPGSIPLPAPVITGRF